MFTNKTDNQMLQNVSLNVIKVHILYAQATVAGFEEFFRYS